MTPKWRPLVVQGELSGTVKRDAERSSGAYAIRRAKDHEVLYVGESTRGRLWKTMLRHFQAPDSFRRVREGFVASSPAGYEVALWVTSTGARPRGSPADQKAAAAQAKWIASLSPSRNKDDGMALAEDFRGVPEEEAIPADPWGGLLNPRRAWTALGLLTKLSFRPSAGGRERTLRWGLRSAPSLVYDASRGAPLVIVYGPTDLRRATPEEVRRYKKTHWGEEGRHVVSSGGVALAPLRALGRGTSIQYTTAKGAEGGGNVDDWSHPWGEGARGKWAAPMVAEHVCQNARCAGAGRVALVGGTYRVTERGIVG